MSHNHVAPVWSQHELLIVYCGGTFGMRHSPEGLIVTKDLQSTLSALIAKSYSIRPNHTWRYISLDPVVDSAEITPGGALHVAGLIRQKLGSADAVIVIHGTDTLTFTAAVAAYALADIKVPIIFTGSQRSIFEPESDAHTNFATALAEALTQQPGVRIAFGNKVLPATRAVKTSTDAFDGFVSIREETSDRTSMREFYVRLHELARYASPQELAPSVGTLRVFPGLAPAIIESFALHYPDGIVLETYGAGTAPTTIPGMQQILRSVINAGTPIVAVTQCNTGTVTLERYAVGNALEQAGVWSGADLTSDAALAKMLVFTALGVKTHQLRECFRSNYVGEQTAQPFVMMA